MKMKYFASSLCVAMFVLLTQACDNCHEICAFEKRDTSYKRTFKNMKALKKFNDGVKNKNERFKFESKGKCKVPEVCPAIEDKICTIPKAGVCGPPLSFDNFCLFDKHNRDNPKAEYEYYHNECCNDVELAECDDCKKLVCKEEWKPVCAIPATTSKPCGQPVTFANRCWLEKFNCEIPEYQFWYFHEGDCLTDKAEYKAEHKAEDKAEVNNSVIQ